jgi:DnaK suppressor protein
MNYIIDDMPYKDLRISGGAGSREIEDSESFYRLTEKTMNKKDLTSLKKILIQKRAEILNKTNKAKREIDIDLNTNVGDEIDTASQNSEKEMYFELVANDRITLDAINDAIVKMEENTYGICEGCNNNILLERLKAIPWTKYCIQCQEKTEAPQK